MPPSVILQVALEREQVEQDEGIHWWTTCTLFQCTSPHLVPLVLDLPTKIPLYLHATLGHGLFTYTILQALKGDADGSNKDKKITVKEISAYLNDKVPELSEKYKGSAQYPNSYGYGQDFPVVIVK